MDDDIYVQAVMGLIPTCWIGSCSCRLLRSFFFISTFQEMHIFATSPSLMTKFATSATEFGKKSNHISGAVEGKHFITGRIITIYIPTICICKGWKEICRGIFLFPREFESFLCCFCTEQSEVQKQHKKDENSRGKERFPTFLFSSKHMHIDGV